MTEESIKALIGSPIGLLVVLLLGSLFSILKQISDARSNGATISVSDYLFRLETVIVLGTNVGVFFALLMTGDLSWQTVVASLGLGYMANSAVDIKPGGRSAAIINSIPDTK